MEQTMTSGRHLNRSVYHSHPRAPSRRPAWARRAAAAFALSCLATNALAKAEPIPTGWQAQGMVPVGYSDLGGERQGFKLAIKQSGDRWYLYKGGDGIQIIDVTDPTNPVYIKRIPGPEGTSARQITLNGNLLLLGLSKPITAEEYAGKTDSWMVVQKRASSSKEWEETVHLYDISDPLNPRPISKFSTGAQGSHRNAYPGGRYAYLATTMPGYRGFILLILDVSDPEHPKEAGRWAYPGSRDGETAGEVVPSFHGPAMVSPDGNVLSLGYTPSVVNLDISDIRHPRLIGELKLIPPFINNATQAIHTVLPLWDRDLLYFSGEPSKGGCGEPESVSGFIDIKDLARPVLLSLFPRPLPPPGAGYKSFCEKGGRFGPHNTVTEIYNPDVAAPRDTMYVAWFTAGLRAFDISNPMDVQEVGWFLPPDPPEPIVSHGASLTTSATQDVLQDARGNIFVSDSAWGLWVLRDTANHESTNN